MNYLTSKLATTAPGASLMSGQYNSLFHAKLGVKEAFAKLIIETTETVNGDKGSSKSKIESFYALIELKQRLSQVESMHTNLMSVK